MTALEPEHQNARPSSGTYEDQIFNLWVELTSYGLTMNQAKIYVFLLKSPASSVRMISKATGLHRVDVYRKLHELDNLGMIETSFNTPRTYSSLPPQEALSGLVHRQEGRVNQLRLKSTDLIRRLDNLNDFTSDRFYGDPDHESSYRQVVGRDNYYAEVRELIRGAHTEVLRMVSAGALMRSFSYGIYSECVEARKRGVSIRMMCQIDPRNRYAKRFAKVVQLRYLSDAHPRFLVADKSVLVMGNQDEGNYLILKDRKVAGVYCYLFENLWRHASEK